MRTRHIAVVASVKQFMEFGGYDYFKDTHMRHADVYAVARSVHYHRIPPEPEQFWEAIQSLEFHDVVYIKEVNEELKCHLKARVRDQWM